MNTTTTPPVALVTGASKRLGRAMVEHLHSKDYCVIIHYGTDATAANTLAHQLNALRRDSAQAIPANLSNTSDNKSLADSSVDRDRKSTRLNSSHIPLSQMPSLA